MEREMTVWQRLTALTAEGLCLLAVLLPRLAEMLVSPYWTRERLLLTAAIAVVQDILLAPVWLGREALYLRLCRRSGSLSLAAMTPGFRRFGAAVGWRIRLWLRRGVAAAAVMLPTALLWSYATVSARTATSSVTTLLCFFGGCGWALFGGVLAAVYFCRYAPVALLLLDGCPVGAVAALSARLMRGHRAEYVDFLGHWIGRLAACLLIVPAIFFLPRFRAERTALLRGWLA